MNTHHLSSYHNLYLLFAFLIHAIDHDVPGPMNQVEQKQHSGVFRILLLLLVLVVAPGASSGCPILVTAPFSVTIAVATRQCRFVSTAYRVSHLELIGNCLLRRLNFWLIYSTVNRVVENSCRPFATKYKEKNFRNERSQLWPGSSLTFNFLRSSRNQFGLSSASSIQSLPIYNLQIILDCTTTDDH